MLDHAKKWSDVPNWESAIIETRRISVRSVAGLTQHLVSGDIERFCRDHGLPIVGGLGLASGDRYAAWMARDRALVVGMEGLAPGWNDGGFAITKMRSALHVFEMVGDGVMELISRGSVIDIDKPGPNSAITFAGVVASLYRHDTPTTLRLHVDRGLAPYIWSWIGSQRLMTDDRE